MGPTDQGRASGAGERQICIGSGQQKPKLGVASAGKPQYRMANKPSRRAAQGGPKQDGLADSSAAGDAAAPHGPALRACGCVGRRRRLDAQLRLRGHRQAVARLTTPPSIPPPHKQSRSGASGVLTQRRNRASHAPRPTKRSCRRPRMPTSLLRQDLADEVAAAAAHVAPHLLAVAVEDEGGDLPGGRGGGGRGEGRSERGRRVRGACTHSQVARGNQGRSGSRKHPQPTPSSLLHPSPHLGHIQLPEQLRLVVAQQARKRGIALQEGGQGGAGGGSAGPQPRAHCMSAAAGQSRQAPPGSWLPARARLGRCARKARRCRWGSAACERRAVEEICARVDVCARRRSPSRCWRPAAAEQLPASPPTQGRRACKAQQQRCGCPFSTVRPLTRELRCAPSAGTAP